MIGPGGGAAADDVVRDRAGGERWVSSAGSGQHRLHVLYDFERAGPSIFCAKQHVFNPVMARVAEH